MAEEVFMVGKQKLRTNIKLRDDTAFKKYFLIFLSIGAIITFMIIFLFKICFFATCPIWNMYSSSVQISDEDLLYRMNITANTTEGKAKEVMHFVHETIEIKTFDTNSPKGIFDRYIKKYPCLRISSKEHAKYLLNSKCGACGEHAILFSYLMNLLNESAPVLSIQKLGGNHAENEMVIENKRVVIDPSDNIYDESRNIEMFPIQKPTYVTLEYIDETDKELTKEYAGVSAGYANLTFYFLNKPLKNTKILFTPINGTSFTKYGDNYGRIEMWLGGNITYKVNVAGFRDLIAKQDSFELKAGEKIENKINIKISVIKCSIYLLIVIVMVLLIKFEQITSKSS